ncbi:MAG: LysR substrate-binding domain-containing protein [Hyphomicrobium aestuarii]|nr:LysR substrate-binding domain-containing protein [Hyphomicrobium aestuarii]
MINLSHVRTFLAVIDERGVRAAAKALALSPSTVVEHVNQLECDLAAPLVIRTPGASRATPQGERFLPHARALIGTAQRARELIGSSVIRLSAASNVGTYLLQQPLAAFRQKTGIEVELWIGSNPAVAERLMNGEADLGATEWWDGRRGYQAIRWAREPLVIIVSPGHRWAKRKLIPIVELLEEPMLGGERGSGTGTLLRERLGPVADRLRTVSGYGSTEAVKRAVRVGHGASIVLAAAVSDEIASNQLVALEIEGSPLSKNILLVTPDQLPASSPSLRLVAELQATDCGARQL